MLEWTHAPDAVSFIPEDSTDNCAKEDDENVVSGETMNYKPKIQTVEQRWKQGIEEEPGKQQLAKFDIMLQDTNFDFADKNIVAAHFLLLNQPQLPKLL